jgi:peptide deformylase
MSECSGPDCTHPSHGDETPPVKQEEVKQTRSPIITPGDPERWPLLEMASKPCQIPLTPADEQAIMDMDTLLDALDDEAAGLAAVQIGFPHRIFLLRNGVGEDGKAFNNVYINPRLVAVSKETKVDGEACLSLPGMGARFERPKEVTLEYFDIDHELQTQTFTGFWARAVMHEMDHLNGTLILKHLEKQLAKQPSRTSFGMKRTPHRLKVIAKRRADKKRARKQRKHQRAIGR